MTIIRIFREDDFDVLVARWHESNRQSFHYVAEHQKHTLPDARDFFRQSILPVSRVWVAARDGSLLGVIALEGALIRTLAVFPEYQRQHVGTALLLEARAHSPDHLQLFTFQRNTPARTFYEHHGFAAVAFGVSPAPECEPDVEYRWVP